MAGIPGDRLLLETDSPYCDIRNTHAGVKYVESSWPSKKKEKHEEGAMVKNRNEPCQIRQVLEVVAGHREEKDVAAFARGIYETTSRVFFANEPLAEDKPQ
eukprot:TRINITY_DN1393_c0_g1_i3.p4 TRINITY_DN1393_c0_g1~~TRINITY_DN1393_c0_g1_i3.p4  ORF type:complete len:101 (-),score=25.17 TRINITY_DN1393_c0_g1_i3:816-1118(-)